MKKNLKIGVVGATGMVGQTFMKILKERNFPIGELRPFASEASLGKKIDLAGKSWDLQVLKEGCFEGLDLVFFSSGDEISLEWAPKAVAAGAFAVDNSAAFRMNPEYPLVVPEVNGHLLNPSQPTIIANPNCSTIQLVVALKPLNDQFGLESVKVSSYQAVSGAGQAGHDELITQTSQHQSPVEPVTFQKQILFNCIPQIGSFNADGFSSEEVKIMKETKKILGLPELRVSAFTVRVPALNSHSEAVWVKLKKEASRSEVLQALKNGQGMVVNDSLAHGEYPTALECSGSDPVFVGRIHQDLDSERMWMMWVVADNIRKGAALNGIQIAEALFS